MDHKQLMLHELLQQDQEPFHLNTYISDKRSHLNYSSPAAALQLTKRSSAVPETCTHRSNLGNACFFSFCNSPDVRKSPLLDFLSPAISPCRSPCGGAFLHVPSRTATVLVEAAMRIQKQRQSKPKTQIMNVGISLFGSFLKILKHRSKNKVLGNYDLKEKENSCTCSRLWIDDLGASTSTYRPEIYHEIGDFELQEAQFCSSPMSPFRFSLHKSPSSSTRRTPEFFSPATSPIRRAKQENCGGGEEVHKEEQEQCSPVSVLDSFFEEEEHESAVGVEDDDDVERSYANIERVRQQLLDRLRRFEELASLDPVELEQKLVEEYQKAGVEVEDDEALPLCKQSPMKRVVCARFSVVESELDEWKRFAEVVEETAAEMEVAILGGLMEELSDELFCMDVQHQCNHTLLIAHSFML